MSRIHDTAAAIETLLEAALPGVPWDIDRQRDTEKVIDLAYRRAKYGVVGVILFGGLRRPERTVAGRWVATLILELWGRSVLQKGQTPLDDILETVLATVDNVNPETAAPAGVADHLYHRLEVQDVSVTFNNQWMRYAVELDVTIQI